MINVLKKIIISVVIIVIVGFLIFGIAEESEAAPNKNYSKRLSVIYQDEYYDGFSNNAKVFIIKDNETEVQYLNIITTKGVCVTPILSRFYSVSASGKDK